MTASISCRQMNLDRCKTLIAELEHDPEQVPAFYSELESAILWLMDTTFESTDPADKTRLAATAMRARLVVPHSIKHWSLTTLREKLIKIGAKVVRHAKYVTFQLAEVAVPRELFAATLDRIQRFGVPPPLVQRG